MCKDSLLFKTPFKANTSNHNSITPTNTNKLGGTTSHENIASSNDPLLQEIIKVQSELISKIDLLNDLLTKNIEVDEATSISEDEKRRRRAPLVLGIKNAKHDSERIRGQLELLKLNKPPSPQPVPVTGASKDLLSSTSVSAISDASNNNNNLTSMDTSQDEIVSPSASAKPVASLVSNKSLETGRAVLDLTNLSSDFETTDNPIPVIAAPDLLKTSTQSPNKFKVPDIPVVRELRKRTPSVSVQPDVPSTNIDETAAELEDSFNCETQGEDIISTQEKQELEEFIVGDDESTEDEEYKDAEEELSSQISDKSEQTDDIVQTEEIVHTEEEIERSSDIEEVDALPSHEDILILEPGEPIHSVEK
ncbi:unnamed protein product [Ambrosiozyma monospora]|uniref:Unnamed protein product n=1 Tax=Ambrosiozyma monospora TaxID=43982 RepID=A0ACB5TCR2_AMBMO|nr:unnamed protein product [Ambrosiozyma monospora]